MLMDQIPKLLKIMSIGSQTISGTLRTITVIERDLLMYHNKFCFRIGVDGMKMQVSFLEDITFVNILHVALCHIGYQWITAVG